MPLINLTYKTECYMTALIDLSLKEIEKMKKGKLIDEPDLIKKIVDESEFDYIVPSMVDLEEIEAIQYKGDWPFKFKEIQLIPQNNH